MQPPYPQDRRSKDEVIKIAKELEVSKASVSTWVRDVELTEAQKTVLHKNSIGNTAGITRGPNKKRRRKRPKGPPKLCVVCGKPRERHTKKYCSVSCQSRERHNKAIAAWKRGESDGLVGRFKDAVAVPVKRYLREKYNNKCYKCGWNEINPYTGIVPLQVEHKDGNYRNNKEENLELLCPNCHSLTPIYGGANRGRGRSDRYRNSYNYATSGGIR
ncbi:MAG: hypothetical protein GF334_06715 [Candidatus Altiarchaeales archaeon]|nr:hypothetical protein [Candidatus Altiarchaeales archaeon]